MAKFRRGRDLKDWKSNRSDAGMGSLRIIGGKFGGRQIQYSGDPVTRPMKDHTREAIFNLVGGWMEGKACFDLFAGTGAVGIEAISRGATQAFLIERHIPTVRIIQENVRQLDAEMKVTIDSSDTFFWVRQFIKANRFPTEPWAVFCCPPYILYEEQTEKIHAMLTSLIEAAPEHSLFIVESREDFDLEKLPFAGHWNSRQYSPAIVSVLRQSDLAHPPEDAENQQP